MCRIWFSTAAGKFFVNFTFVCEFVVGIYRLLTSSNCFFYLFSIHILQFSWLLDSQPIVEVSSLHRYAIDQYVDSAGDVISHLNITHVRTDDGGLYKCIASNSMGSIEHAARLNVYGKSINFGMQVCRATALSQQQFFLSRLNCLLLNSLCSTCAWRAHTFGLRRSWMWMHSRVQQVARWN